MVAQCVVRAEGFRADLADGVVFPAKPNTWSNSARPSSKWKFAYCRLVCSMPSLKLKQRGLLQLLQDLSDPYGRVWRGQTTLADQAGCSDRNLRRLLPELEEAGLLRIERQTFKSLTAAQEALGLPVPDRSDDGRAPNLLTLLVDGRPANELQHVSHSEAQQASLRVVHDEPGPDEPRPSIVRVVPRGQSVQGEPRTKAAEIPPDKLANDPLVSVLDSRKVERDLTRATRPTSDVAEKVQTIVALPSNSVEPTEILNAPPNADAWRALNAAYDAHYRRVYEGSPTNKRVSHDAQKALTTALVDAANVFEKRLRDRNVNVEKLEEKPLVMLANEALRAWFDWTGSDNYLRRRSHAMSVLCADLPYRMREAMTVLVARHAPKPEPRKVVALGSATMRHTAREVSRDKPMPTSLRRTAFQDSSRPAVAEDVGDLVQGLFVPIARNTAPTFLRPTSVLRPLECSPISLETEHILKGLSERPVLREFGTHVSFANELLALGRDHGLGVERVLGTLDELNQCVSRLNFVSKQAKTNALYKAALQVFARMNERFGRGKYDETNRSTDVATGATSTGLV